MPAAAAGSCDNSTRRLASGELSIEGSCTRCRLVTVLLPSACQTWCYPTRQAIVSDMRFTYCQTRDKHIAAREESNSTANKNSQRRSARAFHVIAQAGETPQVMDIPPAPASQPTTPLRQADRIEHPEPLHHHFNIYARQQLNPPTLHNTPSQRHQTSLEKQASKQAAQPADKTQTQATKRGEDHRPYKDQDQSTQHRKPRPDDPSATARTDSSGSPRRQPLLSQHHGDLGIRQPLGR
jgi:hypothetical protein